MMTNNRDFKVLDDREHVLLRPGMYLGQCTYVDREQWIFNKEENKFKFENVKVIPALLKCASELIDNSVDVAIDTNFKYATNIKVNVTKTSIEVEDDGIGIPCTSPDGSKAKDPYNTCACLAWTKLKAGTSFDDTRKKLGTNGVGASCVNVFSKVFIGKSDDGKLKQTITCKDNMSSINASNVSKSSGKSGVKVYCEPDLSRFGTTEIDDVHIGLIRQRLLNLSISYPKIKFKFNGEKVNLSEKKFTQLFSENAMLVSSNNATICVFPNDYDEFKHYSCVNGIDTYRGGTHVDLVASEVSNRIRDKLVKKFKSIRPGDIKNKICLAVFFTDFVNPQFDSQTKESLANSASEVNKHLNDEVDFDKFAKDILKNEAIIDPIVETFKLKEEVKNNLELKRLSKPKVKIDASKYISAIGNDNKYCMICEGFSAMTGLSQALGREGIAYFAGRGVPLNVWDCKTSEIIKNKEFSDIINILGLNPTKENDNMTFDKLVLSNDADIDGLHIQMLYLGWIMKFAKPLFNQHRVARLNTPLVVLYSDQKQTKMHKMFFTLNEYKEYEKNNDLSKYYKKYFKGLGSWSKEQFQALFANSKNGLDDYLQYFILDENGNIKLEHWLADEHVNERKEYLRKYNLDMEMA